MQKIPGGIKSLLEKARAQCIITTIIHLFGINKEDGLLSLPVAEGIIHLPSEQLSVGQAGPLQPQREPQSSTLMCLLCICLPAQKVPTLGTSAVCAEEGPVGEGQQHLHSHTAPSHCFPLSKAAGPFLSWKRPAAVCFESGCVISLLFPCLSLLPCSGSPAWGCRAVLWALTALPA